MQAARLMQSRPAPDVCTLADNVLSTSITASSIGLHMNLAVRPTSGLSYGVIRSHSYSKAGKLIIWRDIETSKGVFDWSVADEWIDAHYGDGKDIIVELSGTPDWAVSAPAVGGAAWGGKSNMPPDNDSDYSDFVGAFAARYAGKVTAYEGWNEPNLAKYWAGAAATSARLASLQRIYCQAVKAADPAALVLSPSFTSVFGGVSGLTSYLAASDGAGGTGKAWFDVCAYHFYANDSALRPTGLERMYRGVSQALAAAGLSKDIWATETGVIVPNFKTLDAAVRTMLVRAYLPTLFALGCKRVLWFAVDESAIGFAGETPADWNAVYAALVGRTIARGRLETLNQTTLQTDLMFTDGAKLSATVTDMPRVAET